MGRGLDGRARESTRDDQDNMYRPVGIPNHTVCASERVPGGRRNIPDHWNMQQVRLSLLLRPPTTTDIQISYLA